MAKLKSYIGHFTGDYRFLSNFWPVMVMLDGVSYPSVEHAYQAAKTIDKDDRERIRMLSAPGFAKRAGRTLRIRSDWEQVKLSIMADLLRQKFGVASLAKLLLATSGRDLIEGNTWGDRYWGVCFGQGENHLGKLLMKIRGQLAYAKGYSDQIDNRGFDTSLEHEERYFDGFRDATDTLAKEANT